MLIAAGDTHVGFGAGWPARGRPDPPPATDRGVRSPIPHGFIGKDYPALGHPVFDIGALPQSLPDQYALPGLFRLFCRDYGGDFPT